MQEKQEWMSPEELRAWLRLGKTKTYELLSCGEIPSYRIGNLHRIRRTDVERWLEGHKSSEEDL